MSASDFDSLLSQFRQALQDCERLYVTSGRECVEQHPGLIPGSPRAFVQLMNDLHKGLLIKIYVFIAEADRRWRPEERKLGEVFFEHIWKRKLTADDLREALIHISQQSHVLKWYSLIRPFDQFASLRNRVGELETIVTRLANLVAKADGETTPVEIACLRSIQEELERHLRPIPLDEPGQHETASALGPQAVRQIKSDCRQLRAKCELESSEAPAASEKSAKASLAEAIDALERLIGMANVKHDIHTLSNFLKMQRQRQQAGLPQTNLSLHMVFSGNPGTGKTTVARILGHILGAMGILSKGHLVETDRSGLVAEYAGQTATKTNKKIDEALDGILFIDEAYSLVSKAGEDAYGLETLQTLIKRMEDDRHRLVVILAGYPEPMERLLRSNPGLSSRFNNKLIFADYTPAELGRIFQQMCDKNHYEVPSLTQAKLLLTFQWLHARRDEHFGNGRAVRNTFEKAIRRLANRIAGVAPVTKELLTVIEPADIDVEGVPSQAWRDYADQRRRFAVRCPACKKASAVPASYLGRRVKCSDCRQPFLAAWGEP